MRADSIVTLITTSEGAHALRGPHIAPGDFMLLVETGVVDGRLLVRCNLNGLPSCAVAQLPAVEAATFDITVAEVGYSSYGAFALNGYTLGAGVYRRDQREHLLALLAYHRRTSAEKRVVFEPGLGLEWRSDAALHARSPDTRPRYE